MGWGAGVEDARLILRLHLVQYHSRQAWADELLWWHPSVWPLRLHAHTAVFSHDKMHHTGLRSSATLLLSCEPWMQRYLMRKLACKCVTKDNNTIILIKNWKISYIKCNKAWNYDEIMIIMFWLSAEPCMIFSICLIIGINRVFLSSKVILKRATLALMHHVPLKIGAIFAPQT